jgi:YVTN family beta-propeller protein
MRTASAWIAGYLLAHPLAAQPAGRDHLLLAVSQNDKQLAIFKVDGKVLSPVKNLPIGGGAREVCIAADGRRAYVSNGADNTVTVVDLETAKVVATIAPPGIKRPDGCATSPDSKKVYVAAMDSKAVVILSADTNEVVKQVEVGEEPRRILFSPDGRRIFVSCEGAEALTVLDAATDAVVDELKVGGHGPRAMIFLSDKTTLLDANTEDDTISFTKVPTKDVFLTIGAGVAPQRLEVSRDGNFAYVLSAGESKVSKVDLRGVPAMVRKGSPVEQGEAEGHVRAKWFTPVGGQPWGMAMSDDGSLLFVSSTKENTVAAYDTATMEVVSKVTLNRPMGVAFR